MMTYEEAIIHLKELRCPEDQDDVVRIIWNGDLRDQAIEEAIESLEKQIPKKPNKVRCLNGKFAMLCPTCGGGLMSMCRCHYAECGQAIDWSEVE